ncbi:transketolase family protein [Roseospira visakhapatnamensis]|uniref:Transketolase n=1 Tax=Roseospira visakhapatnamensis TaxID=390880 RepID=A0A7W6RFA1_9PROT|nr:hypothetical protein [Roseospira visakhapatnamensis]MBB4267475.1 transketolase [Roseospira visakhapatnamensis]
MRRQFRDTVGALAAEDERVVVILGDVSVYQFFAFKQAHPTRFHNMGICEPTLISVTAGMSARGLHPFVHTIAPFLTERCFEQIKLDMGYNRFGGNIVTCGASFDYAWDGATHHAYYDLPLLRLIPGMEVIQPGSEHEVDVLMRSQYANGRPTYFRLSDHPHDLDLGPVRFGEALVLRDEGAPVTVMTAGPLVATVLEGCRDLSVNLVTHHTLKPIDRATVARFRDTAILVVHDGHGLREAINEVGGLRTAYHGLEDDFVGGYGTVHDVRAALGLDPAGIRAAVTRFAEEMS